MAVQKQDGSDRYQSGGQEKREDQTEKTSPEFKKGISIGKNESVVLILLNHFQEHARRSLMVLLESVYDDRGRIRTVPVKYQVSRIVASCEIRVLKHRP